MEANKGVIALDTLSSAIADTTFECGLGFDGILVNIVLDKYFLHLIWVGIWRCRMCRRHYGITQSKSSTQSESCEGKVFH
ncbi:hypothetical protein [Kiloniella sp. EL199]|uniref:hypothetical protein n=1 Tax=Kiloniella sp. EL199 TaxID=2107581 RepID=UPI0013C52CCF|nr:hypothetical protein [Kiloniella sp. EL199]